MPDIDDESHRLLVDGLAALALDMSPDPLLRWLALFLQWNQAKNLSAIRSPRMVIVKHLLDSLAIHPWLHGQQVLDVGTGAGLPGIPLALAFPDRQFVLCDSNIKKIAFVRTAIHHLGLDNVSAEHLRVEAYAPAQPFDSIVSRAFAEVSTLIDQTRHLIHPDGEWLAMRGRQHPIDVVDDYRYQIIALNVPQLRAERHLVRVTNRTS